MADNQAKRRCLSSIQPNNQTNQSINQSNFVVPCNECIRIQLLLIKAEAKIELLTKKCNRQAEKIEKQANEIKSIKIQSKKLAKEQLLLEEENLQYKQVENAVSITIYHHSIHYYILFVFSNRNYRKFETNRRNI